MSWDSFIWFAAAAVILWAVGSALAWTGKNRKPAIAAYCLGLLVFFTFILLMWISLERPPLRTMGETRGFVIMIRSGCFAIPRGLQIKYSISSKI